MAEIKYNTGFRPKMSIKSKLVLSFSFAVLFPLMLLAIVNTFIFKNQTKKDTLNKIRVTLNGAQRIYYSQGERLKNSFLISAYNPYLVNAIKHKNIKFLGSLVESYKKAFNFAGYVGITDKNGDILAPISGHKEFKPYLGGILFNVFHDGYPAVKTALIRKSELTRLGVKIPSSGSNMFLVTVVPFIRSGKVVGSIFALINLNNNSYLPETIYNEYHLRTAVFASVFNRQICLSTLKMPGNVFGIGSRLPDNIHNKIISGKNFIREVNYDGQDIFAAFHPIKDVNGHVIGSIAVFISNNEYLSVFRKTAIYASIIIIIGLFISFIIAYFASKDTLNPIFAIRDAIKDFTQGDLDTKLIIETKDEFEDIGRGFTKMAETVKDREARMEKYNIFSNFLIGSLDFENIISSTLNILEELLNLSSGIIYIYEKEPKLSLGSSSGGSGEENALNDHTSDAASPNAAEGLEGVLIPWKFYGIRKFVTSKISADEGVPGHCLSKRKTIWFHNIPENAVVLKDKLLEGDGVGKLIDYGFCEVFPKDIAWFPLYVGDVNIGVLTVSSILGFEKEDISFLEHATKELSVTLDNSRMHKKLNELSITDELTGLYNRRKLNEMLETEFQKAKRFNNALSILMLDIDHFKSVNDFYGHKVGDIILTKFGSLLNKNTRNIDTATRYGGEEFVIILPQTDFKSAIITAKKIKDIIQDTGFTSINREVTVSIGVASLPDETIKSADDLLKIADDFLYEAKDMGRNRVIGSYAGERVEID